MQLHVHVLLQPQGSMWSSIAKSKQPQPPSWSNPQPPNRTTPTSQQRGRIPSLADNEDDDDLSFWDDCVREAKNNPAPTRAKSNSSSGNGSGHRKKASASKEEVLVLIQVVELLVELYTFFFPSCQQNLRRLLATNDASSEFNNWCDKELHKFNTDVDSKFVIFLSLFQLYIVLHVHTHSCYVCQLPLRG